MTRICPKPGSWAELYRRLTLHAKTRECVPSQPPKPLILNGWHASNDIQKKDRWEETVRWATDNACVEQVMAISDSDFYFVDKPITYAVSPMGGPMHRSWDHEEKDRPPPEILEMSLKTLKKKWSEVAGTDLSGITRPLVFTGRKARRLLVLAESETQPPWGGWEHLSSIESERRVFTKFRVAVNDVISPHEVDHIDFTSDEISKGETQNFGEK